MRGFIEALTVIEHTPILGQKRRRHIDPIKPHLEWIYFCARIRPHWFEAALSAGRPVAGWLDGISHPRMLPHRKEIFAFIDHVQVIILKLVVSDGTIFIDQAVHMMENQFTISRFTVPYRRTFEGQKRHSGNVPHFPAILG